MKAAHPHGSFVDLEGERWYRIDNAEALEPFFISLISDSDLWAFVSTNGSLAAGRRDQEQSFFPYETVDKIHTRWEHTGPRTWLRFPTEGKSVLWEPFANRPGHQTGQRVLYKNVTGTKFMVEDQHPDGNLVIRQQWSSSGAVGLVRKLTLLCRQNPVEVEVLDGLLNLIPVGENNATFAFSSALADAYKWNETHAEGRMGVYTMYAKLWDRAEPKESLEALVAWHSGLSKAKTLLSAKQVKDFCEGRPVVSESLTRGRTSAFLVNFRASATKAALSWYQVVDAPLSQARTADLAAKLASGWGTPEQLEQALTLNTKGLEELLAQADGFQASGNPMAAVHHTANVLFNIMRGGVFPTGTQWDANDLQAFVASRNYQLKQPLAELLAPLPAPLERELVLQAARNSGNHQLERLVREYLPLTFSRRHGDPSRPWNRFSIRVSDNQGARVLNHQGNWRDIFQNWEALLWSEPSYAGSMISTFLSAMTNDGYNPYRIGRDGIDWETVEEGDSWSFIGYWGDHQVVYLLRLLEAGEAFQPGLLKDLWSRRVFAFADVPYRVRPYADLVKDPKATIDFDHHEHKLVMQRAAALGGDGKLVPGRDGQPLLATMAEKLLTIVLSKGGNLVPGGGIWLNTQRPEWNDANNALVGNGLSLVTTSSFRRLLCLLQGMECLNDEIDLPSATADALVELEDLASKTTADACTNSRLRRKWLDDAGLILERWRTALYRRGHALTKVTAPAGLFRALVSHLLPLIDGTLKVNQRADGLYHSYNLLTLTHDTAEVGHLYAMLEGQVSVLSSGLLGPAEALALGKALRASDLFETRRRSYLLYPDRPLPGFLEKNRLDAATLALAPVKKLLAEGRPGIFETQADGAVRFASSLSNRYDVEAALANLGPEAQVVGAAYEKLLGHKAFTGRSGTMFGYEGLGCIYWHMVAKLLLALQEAVFAAADQKASQLEELKHLYREVRAGLGYHKTPSEYGAFPFDPYSHTPGEGGAQQPGMTGQVKEEILTRWGELGLRWKAGKLHFDPVLLDLEEVPPEGALEFTYQRVPFAYRRGVQTGLRVKRATGWSDCHGELDLKGALAVEALL